MEGRLPKSTSLPWRVMTLGWAALIFYFSTRSFGPNASGAILTRMLHLIHLQVSPATFALFHALLRKSAHLTEYAIFSLLLYGNPHEKCTTGWQWRRAAICVAFAAAFSLTDEFHQVFVPGRHASLSDCGLDTIGATLAMLVPYSRR